MRAPAPRSSAAVAWTGPHPYLKLVEREGRRQVVCNRCGASGWALRLPFPPRMWQQPWIPEPPAEPPSTAAWLLEINDVRVHAAECRTALVIPPESRIRRGTVLDRLYGSSRNQQRIRNARNDLARRSAVRRLAREYRCTPDAVEQAIAQIDQGYPLFDQEITQGDLMAGEYRALIEEIPDLQEDEDFVTEHQTGAWRSLDLESSTGPARRAAAAVSRLIAVNRLKEIMVLLGFRRSGDEGRRVSPDVTGESGWLPAAELYGEGVFFTLDEAWLQRWESNPAVRERAGVVAERYRQRQAAAEDVDVSPRFLLCHTLAHVLIRQLDAEAGYPAASLKERIYCREGAQPMAGILIYVAVADEEGSLGGLVELARPRRFLRLLAGAFEAADWCSLDPVCAGQDGHGPDLLNRAACHACRAGPGDELCVRQRPARPDLHQGRRGRDPRVSGFGGRVRLMARRRFELPGIQDLSKEQEAARALPRRGRHLIVGGPGTGKSVLALIRARRHHREQDDYRFLIFNHLLHRASVQLFGDGLAGETWQRWFRGAFERLAKRPVPLLPPSRNGFQAEDWGRIEEAIQGLPPDEEEVKRPFLVIDEGQDMPPAFYESLVDLGFEDFFVVADQNQQITEHNSSRQEIETRLDLDPDDAIELRRNFRNQYRVAKLARAFYTGDPASPPPDLPVREAGHVPQLYVYRPQHLDRVCRAILTVRGPRPTAAHRRDRTEQRRPGEVLRDVALGGGRPGPSPARRRDLPRRPPPGDRLRRGRHPGHQRAGVQGARVRRGMSGRRRRAAGRSAGSGRRQAPVLRHGRAGAGAGFHVHEAGRRRRRRGHSAAGSRDAAARGVVMVTETLFESGNPSTPVRPPASGLLVTNHLNLMYMLAAGLVMPPAGFGDKYYRDTLGCFPGWIPLFIDRVSGEAIASSTREAGHLRPIVAEIGLAGLSGPVLALGPDLRELRFPDELDGAERLILVPAPLPVSWIESVVFRSAEDRQACEADAKDFGNVPLQDFTRRVAKTLFTRAFDAPWPPVEGPAERPVALHASLSAGGVMAMLLLAGNRGDLAVRSCRDAFDPEDGSLPPVGAPILAGLRGWMRAGAVSWPADTDERSESADPSSVQSASQARLFWGAVDRLVSWHDTVAAGSAEDAVLDYLDAASTTLDARLRAGAGRLRDTLVELRGLAGVTASELFDRHATPLARAMILFLLRRDCADLLDFDNDRLHEADRLAAAVLFGVRDGWLGLPLRLRATSGLSAAVSHRMARMAHRLAGSDLDLGEPPARIRPLRELFGDGSAWRAREARAALELARAHEWDCIRTRISLGRGAYTLTVEGGAVHVEVPGEPRITPEVDPARFVQYLAKERMDPKIESSVRGMLRA